VPSSTHWATVCAKCKKVVPKKTAETDAIFEQLAVERVAVQDDPTKLRLSLDAKATVLIGAYSRRGKSRFGGQSHGS
jgi:hypothetical protein